MSIPGTHIYVANMHSFSSRGAAIRVFSWRYPLGCVKLIERGSH